MIKFTLATVLLEIPSTNLFNVHTCIIDAVTIVPPSITTCPGQTVIFNCTANGIPIIWSVFTPNMNYTNLEINNIQVHSESMDGVIMADLIVIDMSAMTLTIVSSLTVNVTAELEGSKVQCLGLTVNGQDREIKSGLIHITGDNYLHIRHIIDVLPKRLYFTVRFEQVRETLSLKPYNIFQWALAIRTQQSTQM